MKERVIQFGEGGFLRGFVDYFFQKLTDKGLFDGKIVVVQPIEKGLVSVLNEQNGKYNLFLRGIQNGEVVNEHTEISVISRGINPYTDYEGYLKLAENPDFRYIVSNTTEAGIEFLDTDKLTDQPPKAFPAKLTQLLYKRYQLQLDGFVILSCELIDNNGDELKRCVKEYAKLWNLEDGFVQWLDKENHFCNTLVDRIVTGYPREEAKELEQIIGYPDQLIDTAEIFHLWVIQGDFEEELPFCKAGYNIVWTDDVTPYKKRKVRILNGAHTSMVPYAMLEGLETVGDCMKDEKMSTFLKDTLFNEIMPTIDMDKADLESFTGSVLERFQNPFIRHLLSSIALNSVSKFKVRVLPSLLEYVKRFDKLPKNLVLSLAKLIQLYKTPMANDSAEMIAYMKDASVDEILSNESLWDTDLSFLADEVKQYVD